MMITENITKAKVIATIIATTNNPKFDATKLAAYNEDIDKCEDLLATLHRAIKSLVETKTGISTKDSAAIQGYLMELRGALTNEPATLGTLFDNIDSLLGDAENLFVDTDNSNTGSGNFGTPTEDNEPAVNDYILKVIKTRINKNGGTHVMGRMLDMQGNAKIGRREFHKNKGFADDVILTKGSVIGVGLIEGKIAGVTTYRDEDGILHFHGGSKHVKGQAITSTGLEYLENYDIDADIMHQHSLKVRGEAKGKIATVKEILALSEAEQLELKEAMQDCSFLF